MNAYCRLSTKKEVYRFNYYKLDVNDDQVEWCFECRMFALATNFHANRQLVTYSYRFDSDSVSFFAEVENHNDCSG